ncbi:MAG: helix-turn-helix domain-containing protein [archaeon]
MKHDCMLGNRCQEFKIILQSIMFNTFKKDNFIYTYSMHIMQGKNKEKYIESLKKDKDLVELERTGDTFFLVEKQKQKAGGAYTGDILFIKPAVTDTEGVEHWEVASPKKESLMKYIEQTKKHMDMFKLIKMKREELSSIFFPRLLPEMTSLQKEIIELAINKGYYEIPKKIDIRKLANIKKISHSTFQEHLKKAEKKIIPSLTDYMK